LEFRKTLMTHGLRMQVTIGTLAAVLFAGAGPTWARQQASSSSTATAAADQSTPVQAVPAGTTPELARWAGLEVSAIEFKGVSQERLAPLPSELPQQAHTGLNPEHVEASLRRLFATGLYKNIVVEGVRHGGQVTLIFSGEPTTFLGQVTVHGIKNTTLHNRIAYAPGLIPGTPFDSAKLLDASGFIKGRCLPARRPATRMRCQTWTSTLNWASRRGWAL
jgi:outer membrane protein assembly factor BamA